MNVMHLVQHLQVGGLEKMAITLLQNSQFKHSSIIVSLEGDRNTAFEQWPELEPFSHRIICLNKKPGISLSVIAKIKSLIKEHDINIIHSHHIGPLIYAGIASSLSQGSVRHISTIHDAWYLTNTKQRTFTKLLDSLTNIYWVADARIVADEFRAKTAIIPERTILNGIDCENFMAIDAKAAREQFNLPNNVRLIGCAARLIEGKGHKDMIHSLRYLPDDFHMVFAGDGDQKEYLLNLVRSLHLTSRVHFLGNVHDMRAFYSSIDVMCLYSQREGLPLSIIEAMACGIPIVASDVGGIHEVVTPEQGELVSVNDFNQLAPAIQRACTLPRGLCIRHHAIKVADARTMSSKYDNLYSALLM
ncbi:MULTISPECIES: glycosyltransferase [unclassified Pseudoalteromonas]|uniref:glycosyltransferase n=1 Tax=unclassified Pseudoalteromonas TaxID=194690 RepID=UPI0011082DD6|nr:MULTISPECIES: glycosyltransferase [unclassified Pseudoalteromonas]TMO44699.1 glycosyltransferase [Pseudoalteromonas sp. S4389]